jgi:hypothetical protein
VGLFLGNGPDTISYLKPLLVDTNVFPDMKYQSLLGSSSASQVVHKFTIKAKDIFEFFFHPMFILYRTRR